MSIKLGTFLSRRWHTVLLLHGSYLCTLEFAVRLLKHTAPSPSSLKDGACAHSVEDLALLIPQVPSGYTNTRRVHFYEQGGSGLENGTVQDLRTQWDWLTVQIYI